MRDGQKTRVALLAMGIDFGGAEKVIVELIKNVETLRFEIMPIIFTRKDISNDLLLSELGSLGKSYFTISMDKTRLKALTPVCNLLDAWKILRNGKFQLVHTHGYRCDVLGTIAAKLIGLPVVSTCHGFISTERKLRFYNAISTVVLRFCDKIIAVSDTIKKGLIETGIREDKIVLIPNAVGFRADGIELEERRRSIREYLQVGEEEFVAGYAGRLSEEKGVTYLIEAISLLRRLSIPMKLIIIGDGPQRKELEGKVQSRNLGKEVIFVGFQKEIDKWLTALDVFVLPSLTEGLPMALLEAMNAGIPVVASAVGGVPRVVISEKNGILVSPRDSESIKCAIKRMIESKFFRNHLAAEARITIRREYDIGQWVGKIEEVYLKVVSQWKNKAKFQSPTSGSE